MDKLKRTALQKNHMMIVEDLLVTDDFLGQCFQDDLFDYHLIEIIKVMLLGFSAIKTTKVLTCWMYMKYIIQV